MTDERDPMTCSFRCWGDASPPTVANQQWAPER